MNIFGNSFRIAFDESTKRVTIECLDNKDFQGALGGIGFDVLAKMSLAEASQFLGERILLLNPAMRELFKPYFHPDSTAEPSKAPKKGKTKRRN